MATTNLEKQANEIDSPNKPIETIKINREAIDDLYSGSVLSTPGQYADFREQSQDMAPQIQGEFQDYDPDLDRGLMSGDDQYNVRAENQTGWDRTKAGLFKLANEVTLGTLSATALMLDMDMHGEAIQGTEQEFSNSFSRSLDELKQSLNEEYGKIYRPEGTEGFNPGSWAFWADNMDTVGTTLTLMIPSMGAAGLAQKALKSIGRYKRLSQGVQNTIKGVTAAGFSRLTENAMEASETVKSMAEELRGEVNPNTGEEYTEEEVRQIAGEAGVSSWRKNWAMIGPDLIQYTRAFKGIDFARASAKQALKKSFASKIGSFVIRDMGSEGVEEGYQYISSQEAQRSTKVDNNLIEDESGFLDRLADYITEDEFKTSVLMGAIGGGLFSGGRALYDVAANKQNAKEKMRVEDLRKTYDASVLGSVEKFEQAEDSELLTNAIHKAQEGKLNLVEEDLDTLLNTPENLLTEQGVDPKQYRDRITKAKQIVKEVGKEHNRVMNSSLPSALKSSVLFSRMDRKLTEQQRTKLAEAKELAYDADLQVFTGQEKETALQMVELKRLERAGNKAKADELAKDIVANSREYKNTGEVYSALSTSNDAAFEQLDAIDQRLKRRIKEADEFEKDLKSERGIEKRLKEAEIRQAKKEKRREEAAKKKAENAEDTKTDEEVSDEFDPAIPMTDAQMEFERERRTKAEKFGEFDPGVPDGKKVFTTFNKEHRRTWVRGEIVKDSKGNEWRVQNPIKGNSGVFLKRETPTKKKGEINQGTSFEVTKKYGKLSQETQKPGRKDWTVNKQVKDPIKQRQAEAAQEAYRQERVYENVQEGIIETSGQEFDNYKPLEDEDGNPVTSYRKRRVWGFTDTTPHEGHEEWFPIDYETASLPMSDDLNKDVTIVLDTSMAKEKGKDAIRVEQEVDGEIRNIAMIMPRGMEQQFDSLMAYLEKNGGRIKAKISGKYVTPEGNLGNIPGNRTKLTALQGSPFLPNNKIYIGSRKNTPKEGKEVEFYPLDGSDPIKIDVSIQQNERKSFMGNTFMLILSPDGSLVPIQLNEASLDEVTIKDENGNEISMTEKIYNELSARVEDLNNRYNEMVNKAIDNGASIKSARQKAKKYFGFVDTEGKTDTPIQNLLNRTVWQFTRRVHQQVIKEGKKKPRRQTGPNFFNVKLEVVEGEGALENKIEIIASDAVAEEDKGKINEFKAEQTRTPEGIMEKLGKRFVTMSLDRMRSPEGSSFLKQAVNEGWVTTDLNVTRPWVNTRLELQLDSGAKKALKKDTKKPTKVTTRPSHNTGNSKAKPGTKTKSRNDVAKDDTSILGRDDIIKKANRKVNSITELMTTNTTGKPEYTIKDFIDEYLNGLITEEQFKSDMQEAAELFKQAKPEMRDLTARRQAVKEIISYTIDNATDSELGIDSTVEDNNEAENTVKNTKTEKEQEAEQESKPETVIEEVINNSSFIKLSKDGKTYVNTKTGKVYQRVSNFISKEAPDPNNPNIQTALEIGTKVDELVRDALSGLPIAPWYDIASDKIIDSFVGQLLNFKSKLEARGETIYANDIVLYNDELGVAGEVDLLTVDNKGDFRIYDMKTMKGNQITQTDKTGKTKFESTWGGTQISKKQKYTDQLSMYRILLNNTHGVKAKSIEIIPIETMWTAGKVEATKLNLLPNVKLKASDTVKEASISDAAIPKTEKETKATKKTTKTAPKKSGIKGTLGNFGPAKKKQAVSKNENRTESNVNGVTYNLKPENIVQDIVDQFKNSNASSDVSELNKSMDSKSVDKAQKMSKEDKLKANCKNVKK